MWECVKRALSDQKVGSNLQYSLQIRCSARCLCVRGTPPSFYRRPRASPRNARCWRSVSACGCCWSGRWRLEMQGRMRWTGRVHGFLWGLWTKRKVERDTSGWIIKQSDDNLLEKEPVCVVGGCTCTEDLALWTSELKTLLYDPDALGKSYKMVHVRAC